MKVGQNIRKIRELKGLSQEFMASKLDISQSAYSDLENNKTQLSTERLSKVAHLLDVSINDVINFSDKNVFKNTFNENSKGFFNVEQVILESFDNERIAYKDQIEHLKNEITFLRGLIETKQ